MTIIKPGMLAAGDLPLHPTLTHPKTGTPIRAIGRRRDGQLIWPALGASPDDGGNGSSSGDDGGGQGDQGAAGSAGGSEPGDNGGQSGETKPLGPGGQKALREEREARKALEKQLAELAPLKQLADLLGSKPTGDGKTDLEKLTERLTQHETELAAERAARFRAEVAAEKGLTPKQAARLVGTTREELAADADELLATFAATSQAAGTATGGERRPGMRPDPAQGARPGQKTSSLDAGRSLYAERHNKKTTTTT